jgi:two-component system OmpR family response regulator
MMATAERPRIAIVEDEPFMAQLVCDMLTFSGLDVDVFLSGADLLKCKDLHAFKTIILDLSLPDLDGFEIMDRLAAGAGSPSLLLMSGHDLSVVRAATVYGRGIGLQIRGALSKPFSRDDLIAALGLPA